MYSRHPQEHLRQPPTRPASWDRQPYAGHDERIPIQPRADERQAYPDSRRHSSHQFDDRPQPDFRFQPDRPARASYGAQPRAHTRLVPTSPFDESAHYQNQHARRHQDFMPAPHHAPRHISYPHHSPRIPTEPYHHPGPRSGPPSRAYPPQGPAHHEEGAWNHAPQHPRYYEANTQFNHGPPKDKSTPTQSVIFMGLPVHTDESSLRDFLEQRGGVVDKVTIIYDRLTGCSKRYGFARFATIDHARAFVEPSFPMIVWKEPIGSRFDKSGEGLKVKIDYSAKEKIPFETRQREQFEGIRRSPPMADSNDELAGSGSHSPLDNNPSSINDGARDIGGTPTSILLLRGLDPISTEQEIAKHLQHIPDPSQTVLPDSVRKVMLIKDRLSNVSWGYAFVQFSDVQIAVKALSLLLNTSLFPRGFQIRARALTVTFAHEHSFHPVYTSSDWSFKGPGGQELAYWDDKAYAAVFVPAVHITDITEDSQSHHNGVKTGQDWLYERKLISGNNRDDDEDMKELLSSLDNDQKNTSSKPNITSGAKPSSFNHTHHQQQQQQLEAHDSSPSQESNKNTDGSQVLYKSTSDLHRTESRDPRISANKHLVSSSSSNKNDLVEQQQQQGVAIEPSQSKETNIKAEKKKGTELIVSKKNAVNIEKWNSKKTQEISTNAENNNQHHSSANHSVEKTLEISKTEEGGNQEDLEEDFSDLDRLTCVLCQRLFKTAPELSRHNELSTLHKTNLQSEDLKRAARTRMNPVGTNNNNMNKSNSMNKRSGSPNDLNNESGSTTIATKYTDRAAARRETYGQPDAPDADKHEAKKARYEPAPERVLVQAQPDKDGILASNVGSKMLSKMGWNAGEGLGNGNGRVDPVTAAQYTKGVGLGASTGTVVGTYDDSKKGFMEQVKDKTVERFNKD